MFIFENKLIFMHILRKNASKISPHKFLKNLIHEIIIISHDMIYYYEIKILRLHFFAFIAIAIVQYQKNALQLILFM